MQNDSDSHPASALNVSQTYIYERQKGLNGTLCNECRGKFHVSLSKVVVARQMQKQACVTEEYQFRHSRHSHLVWTDAACVFLKRKVNRLTKMQRPAAQRCRALLDGADSALAARCSGFLQSSMRALDSMLRLHLVFVAASRSESDSAFVDATLHNSRGDDLQQRHAVLAPGAPMHIVVTCT